ncbi:MAG: ABC transporter substrate-binding protein [Deltaproteobacteria bacterium]|nr:ABC transporter substrate-binding protein [Deltaproteobacteria bacterium]
MKNFHGYTSCFPRFFWVLVSLLMFVPGSLIAEPAKWKIGILAPLSGDVASWGLDTRRAVELANEMLGNGQFELIFEDDVCLGKSAVSAAKKLVEIDHVQFAMIVCTEPTIASAPIFERAKVVVVAPGATGSIVTNAGDYIFRTWPSDSKMAEAVFEYVAAKYKRPATITEMRGFPQEFSRVFLDLAKARGLAVSSEDFQTGETDFRSLLMKLRAKNPDVLMVSADSERTLLAVVAQVQSLKWKIPLVAQYIAGTPGFYEKAGSAAEGLVFGDSPDVDCTKDKPGCQVFKEFMRRYGKPQSTNFMIGSTIASFMAIAESARSGKAPKEALYEMSIATPLGEISFDKNGDVLGPKHLLRVIKNSQPQVLSE